MLGLRWPAWGETDVLLAMARRIVDASLCPCGCGQDYEVSTDPETEGRWQPTVSECYARAALEEYRSKHDGDLPAGALLGVSLLPEGVEVRDELTFDKERAAAEWREHQARFGL